MYFGNHYLFCGYQMYLLAIICRYSAVTFTFIGYHFVCHFVFFRFLAIIVDTIIFNKARP